VIEHLVLFRWRPDASVRSVEQAIAGLRALAASIPEIRDLHCGENTSDRAQGYTHAATMRFDDRAALERYLAHPAHVGLVRTRLEPILDSTIDCDLDDGG
jgi:hypothetical protein